MRRWKSPQTAAKRAERAAREAEQRRSLKRNSWLVISGIALASISLMVGDYLWLKARARRQREQYMEHHERPAQTNAPASAFPAADLKGAATNRE